MKQLFYILTLLFPFFVIGQKDTLKGNSNTVSVIKLIPPYKENQLNSTDKINEESIQNSVANSIGDVLKKSSGVQIKDYGGIGGLQTISIRGIGANHTGIIRNGVLVSAGQGGQVNLGNIPIESVNSISKSIGSNNLYLQSAKSYRFASTVSIFTHLLSRTKHSFSSRFNFGYGSFGTFTGNLGLKYAFGKTKWNRHHLAINVNGLASQGNFPYQIPNSGSDAIYLRNNSKIYRYQSEIGARFRLKKGIVLLSYLRSFSNQELPNAVVLFVFKNQQYLKQINDQFHFTSTHYLKKINIKPSVTYQYLQTEYIDSNVLNSQGYIHDKYFYHELRASLAFNYSNTTQYNYREKFKLYGAFDYEMNLLESSKTSIENPTRHQAMLVVGTRFLFPKIRAKLDMNVIGQGIFDQRDIDKKKEIWALNPYLGFGIIPSKKIDFRLRLFYKNSIRLPSFNDMYYTQIGNLDLKTEKAHQINVGLSYFIKGKSSKNNQVELNSIGLHADVYHNFVSDKILAIPSKDLFVWSILNVGKAQITGLDAKINLETIFFKKLKMEWNGNYTFQRALDKTNPENPSFNHQLAYIPWHTFNSTLGFTFYGVSIGWTANYTGKRYHLNQNIESNLLQPFWYHDLNLSYAIKIKKQHQLRLLFSIGNIGDHQYEVVRSFPMMRRNFKIKLSYAFN